METKEHKEIIENFNQFIKKWVKPEYIGHLLDNDENDGKRVERRFEK